MNMELVEMENANQLCFFALGDSSSSSSSPSVNQRREWCLLVCLKEQASTKIHFRAKIFRGKTSYSEAEKGKNKIRPLSTKPYHTGALPPPSPICKTPMQGGCCGKGIAPGKCHAETWDGTRDRQIFSLTLSQLSYRGPVHSCRCC